MKQADISAHIGELEAAAAKRKERIVVEVIHADHCQWRLHNCTYRPTFLERSAELPAKQLSIEGAE